VIKELTSVLSSVYASLELTNRLHSRTGNVRIKSDQRISVLASGRNRVLLNSASGRLDLGQTYVKLIHVECRSDQSSAVIHLVIVILLRCH
jgi:hypothetical protein